MLDDSSDNSQDWSIITLNPHTADDESQIVNPTCPMCGEKIQAQQNEHERRYVCGCEVIHEFRFKEKD